MKLKTLLFGFALLTLVSCQLVDNRIRGSFIDSGTLPSVTLGQLQFLVQPSNVNTGSNINPAIQVQALDSNGVLDTSYTGSVTLSLQTDPLGYAVLSGNLTASVVNGVATFSNVSLDEVASGYKLKATAPNMAEAISGSFDVIGPTMVYRSVGPGNTSPLALGASNAMTISGVMATFTNPLPDHIGVGDVIQYDNTGDSTPDVLAFIHGRTSSTQYKIKQIDGSTLPITVTAKTDWSICRAYTSLFNAEAQTENTVCLDDNVNEDFDTSTDLTLAGGKVWNIALYGDATDTTAVAMGGWTLDATHYLRLFTPYSFSEVGNSQRHNGRWTSSAYTLHVTGGNAISTMPNLKLEGLQIEVTNPPIYKSGVYCIWCSGPLEVSHSIIKGSAIIDNSGVNGIFITSPADDFRGYFYNNIIYGFDENIPNPPEGGITCTNSGGLSTGAICHVYNNTVIGKIQSNGSNGWEFKLVAKNNIATTFIENTTNGSDKGYFSDDSNNNISLNGSTTDGAQDQTNVSLSFIDSANKDYRLHTTDDTEAINQGLDLSVNSNLPFNTDILGRPRGQGAGWDIGAFETAETSFVDSLQTAFDQGTFTDTESTEAHSIRMVTDSVSNRELKSGDLLFDASLVGLWHFNEASWNGTLGEVIDSSVSGVNGTRSDGADTAGSDFLNNAGVFDGDNDTVIIPSNPAFTGLTAVTASVWFKTDYWYLEGDASCNGGDCFTNLISKSNFASQREFRLRYSNALIQEPTLSFSVSDDCTNTIHAMSDASIAPNVWHHIVGTWDTATSDVLLYIDGELVDSQTLVATNLCSGSSDLYIGGTDDLGINKDDFKGDIDEVALWSRALTNVEVKDLYDKQKLVFVGPQPASFVSQVFDSLDVLTTWWGFEPEPKAPYGKELPTENEVGYSQDAMTNMSGLEGLWHFNGAGGIADGTTGINDSSANANHGTASNPNELGLSYVDSILAEGISFDGVDDCIDTGNTNQLNNFTVGVWIKSDHIPNNSNIERVLHRGNNYQLIWNDTGGAGVMGQFGLNTVSGYHSGSIGNITPNKWHFIAATYDGNRLLVYNNGIGVSVNGSTSGNPLAEANSLTIGCHSATLDKFFKGEIDEVSIWNRVLTHLEIQSLYKRGVLRLKYQVSTCAQSDCSDSNFVGYDGTNASFYSELPGPSTYTPLFNLFGFGPNRYFQYKAIFETDDTNYSPELEKVTVEGSQ